MEAIDRARQLIASYAGLDPPEWALRARIEERMLASGAKSPESYVERVGRDARELSALCEALRVGETRFFRHRAHVEALERRIIPHLSRLRQKSRQVLGWSAGCASGEEAYTLAILLRERLPAGFGIRVLATDLSAAALEHAREGRYSNAAVGEVPAELRDRHLLRDGDAWRVRPELAALVDFQQQSLTAGAMPRAVDVLLCRNVLIYFDRAARKRTLDRLVAALAPGGALLLGYAEFVRDHDELEPEHVRDGVIYFKRDKAPEPAPAVRREVTAPAPLRPVAPPPVRSELAIVALDGVIADAHTATQRLRSIVGRSAIVLLDGADYLADEVAVTLRRAAAGAPLVVVASRPGVLRWIGRTGLGEDVRIAADLDSARRELER